MFRVVIPARYASTRLPGKPLRSIGGKPMIQHVHERAQASGASEVWIATDDERIEKACRAFGARVAMTDANHASGTDRIAEIALRERWADEDIVVNVQGDEPLLSPAMVSSVAALLPLYPKAGMATLATPILSLEEFHDPNIVKVARGTNALALYFSRAPIPWPRDDRAQYQGALRHIGLYAYRVGALKALSRLAPSPLEQREKLEQLRALENGIAIAVAVAEQAPPAGVDTEEDLARVERLVIANK